MLMDKPFYLGLSISELSNLLMYVTYYDKLQPFWRNLQLHCLDTDSFVPSVNTTDIIKDLRNLEDIFDFSNLDENHDIISYKKIN